MELRRKSIFVDFDGILLHISIVLKVSRVAVVQVSDVHIQQPAHSIFNTLFLSCTMLSVIVSVNIDHISACIVHNMLADIYTRYI